MITLAQLSRTAETLGTQLNHPEHIATLQAKLGPARALSATAPTLADLLIDADPKTWPKIIEKQVVAEQVAERTFKLSRQLPSIITKKIEADLNLHDVLDDYLAQFATALTPLCEKAGDAAQHLTAADLDPDTAVSRGVGEHLTTLLTAERALRAYQDLIAGIELKGTLIDNRRRSAIAATGNIARETWTRPDARLSQHDLTEPDAKARAKAQQRLADQLATPSHLLEALRTIGFDGFTLTPVTSVNQLRERCTRWAEATTWVLVGGDQVTREGKYISSVNI